MNLSLALFFRRFTSDLASLTGEGIFTAKPLHKCSACAVPAVAPPYY